jgi:hypothetical protein
MSIQIGLDPSSVLTSAERLNTGKGWAPGSLARDRNGYEWIYVQAGAALPQNKLTRVLASAHQAFPFASAGVAGTAGAVKCYAVSASASIASGSYGWVMTKGQASLTVAASATGTYSPGAQLYALASAAVAGTVSSTATTTHFAAIGLTVAATATTSTIASAIPVVFFGGITMTTVEA